jgi:alkaline phosphatase
MNRDTLRTFRRLAIVLTVATVTVLLSCRAAWAAKNVIIMISDGAGHNTWLATSMYQGKVGKQVYDQPGWSKVSCTTYPLTRSTKPTGGEVQDRSLVYDPVKAWDATPTNSPPGGFAGYVYLTTTPTDSAAAATALATGRKTYNAAINWSNDNRPMLGQTIAEIAKKQGKSVGAITTVQWSDATPAGLGGAHNVTRKNHAEIASEMLDIAWAGRAHIHVPWIDVIMGAGNPDFDNDGRPLPVGKARNYGWVGGESTWKLLKAGGGPWKLIESKADFEALTTGPTPPKVLGTAQVAGTLQEKRGRDRATRPGEKTPTPEPFAVPPNQNVPTLATMTRGAIHCLERNPHGFYLMIEGGAVDWTNHANEPERMIEEQVDFVKAVEAVVAWVETHGGWDETLLILTADHECGMVWGPDSAKIAFQPLVDHGPGKLPGMKHNSHGHSNSLVPLYACGPGSRRFAELARDTDDRAAAVWHFPSPYVDNTDVFRVMREEVEGRKANDGG